MIINKKNNYIKILPYILVGISYLFTVRSTGFIMGIAILIWIFLNDFTFKRKKIKYFIIPILFYLILIISGFLSNNKDYSLKLWVRFISFIIVPIMFVSKNLTKKDIRIIIKYFVLATFIFYFINWGYAFYRQLYFSFVQKGTFNWYFFYRYDFLSVFHNHPTYVSIVANMSLAFLFFTKPHLFKKPYQNLSILFVIISILFTGSRIGILISICILVLKIIELIHAKHLLFAYKTISVLLLMFLIIWIVPISREKIIYRPMGVKTKYEYYLGKNKTQPKVINDEKTGRFVSWNLSWNLIKKKPLLGYGIGDAEKFLLSAYKKNNFKHLYEIKHNVHNSYLQFWLMGGLFLFLLYFLMIAYPFYLGITTKNYLLISYAIIVGLSSVTESFVRIQGIVFIIYFYCLLMLNYYEKKKN